MSLDEQRQQTLHHKEVAGSFLASLYFRSQLVVQELGQVNLFNNLNHCVLAVPLLILLDGGERIAGDGDGGLAASHLSEDVKKTGEKFKQPRKTHTSKLTNSLMWPSLNADADVAYRFLREFTAVRAG